MQAQYFFVIVLSMEDFTQLKISPNDPSWPKMIKTTDIPGLLIYERETFTDVRGFFHEVIELRDLEKVLGKTINVVQSNHARSHPKVIRGFHAETWEKIIYVARGEVMAVIVDFRVGSPAFGKALKFMLGENNRNSLYLPQGLGNSMCVIGSQDAEYLYLITQYFEGKPTPAVSYKDPIITRQFGGWPVDDPIVSKKDQDYPTLEEKFGTAVDFSRFPWLKS